jgi:hypothetical protein
MRGCGCSCSAYFPFLKGVGGREYVYEIIMLIIYVYPLSAFEPYGRVSRNWYKCYAIEVRSPQ